jgi:hypothetical protein
VEESEAIFEVVDIQQDVVLGLLLSLEDLVREIFLLGIAEN